MQTQCKKRRSSLFGAYATKLLLLLILALVVASCGGGINFDDNPPTFEISIVAKEIETTITDPLAKLRFEIDKRFNVKSFQVLINNIDRTDLVTLIDNVLEIQPTPTATLPSDYLKVTLIIINENDFSVTQHFDFTIDIDVSLSASFSAVPQIGFAPTEITFTPNIAAEESIQLYHWDFGDGTKDEDDTDRANLIGSPITHTYTEAGEYKVVLTVYDSKNQPASSELIVKIANQPPAVTHVEAAPSNGALPLEADFFARAEDNEGIKEYQWDFDGDGIVDVTDVIDESSNKYTSSSQTFTYEKVGSFQATLKVIDVNDVSVDISIPTIGVFVGPVGTPSITAYVSPSSGQAPLNANFSTSGFSISRWEWDFEGDGIFDYGSNSSGTVEHTYTEAGAYFAKVRVLSENGLVSSDTVLVVVEQNIQLTTSTDTIDIRNTETVDLSLIVAAKAETSLVIENARYETVATLLDWEQRSGSFSISWDGKDESGVFVPEGPYYAVLLHKDNGAIKRFDLREERINRDIPIRTNVSAGQTFAPFLAPLSIEFTLDEAAEVSLDIGPDGSSVTERIKTLLQKHPMGKGTYTLEWAGDANDGTQADLSLYKAKYPFDANYYMTGAFKNKLADNAIFVKSDVSVLNLKSNAPVYVPNALDDNGKRNELGINFELSTAASVTLSINDAETGAKIMSKDFSSLNEGEQTIHWDGKNQEGKYIAPGVYRLGIKAKDSVGSTSLTQYTLQRIFY